MRRAKAVISPLNSILPMSIPLFPSTPQAPPLVHGVEAGVVSLPSPEPGPGGRGPGQPGQKRGLPCLGDGGGEYGVGDAQGQGVGLRREDVGVGVDDRVCRLREQQVQVLQFGCISGVL